METASRVDWAGIGRQRLDICDQAKSNEDWRRLWFDPPKGYPFQYGSCWNFCTEYRVADFEAETGFFTDGMCFDCYVLQRDYAMFTDPNKAFYFSFVPAGDGEPTSPSSFRLGFMVDQMTATIADLESRGISMTTPATHPWPGSPMLKATFETPNGIPIDLWGMEEPA